MRIRVGVALRSVAARRDQRNILPEVVSCEVVSGTQSLRVGTGSASVSRAELAYLCRTAAAVSEGLRTLGRWHVREIGQFRLSARKVLVLEPR